MANNHHIPFRVKDAKPHRLVDRRGGKQDNCDCRVEDVLPLTRVSEELSARVLP
jgi:hypothetical protein